MKEVTLCKSPAVYFPRQSGEEGAICIDGICFRGNLFDEEQWEVVESLMTNASAGTKWVYEKQIKELRSKHRKVVKKIKDKFEKERVELLEEMNRP